MRCLAAWIALQQGSTAAQQPIEVETEAGIKRLELLSVDAGKYTFRAAMGQPEANPRERISVRGEEVSAVTMRVGNPQCVVLGEVSEARLHAVASQLAIHPRFPEGTNVELATVVSPDHVRILIWERGVGPTEASGTGACAAAVAAMRYGGAASDLRIESPGGTQRVEWRDDHFIEQSRLVAIIAEQQRLADIGQTGDFPRCGAAIAAFGKQLPRSVADALDNVLTRAPPPPHPPAVFGGGIFVCQNFSDCVPPELCRPRSTPTP